MKNGQLGTMRKLELKINNQFITGFSVHLRSGDTGCLIPHFNLLKRITDQNQIRSLPIGDMAVHIKKAI
ncbi:MULTISPECIES: hypothetical protein [Bacillaceae]|uniref:hypothetical protein n=1 Tax=Bacillaceae TaxID=186817 RepID=UPI000C76735D|nr:MULTISPECIES: hypothetical protein [Bacillaceae]PLR66668.1 hypothetical protein CYJ36_15430 [Bacillus sp. UMB0893]QNG61341.1 hypothetical protein H4O14_07670 [Bacillus sp. PAMC26568]